MPCCTAHERLANNELEHVVNATLIVLQVDRSVTIHSTDYKGAWMYYKPRGDSLVPVARVCLQMDRKCTNIIYPCGANLQLDNDCDA